MAAIIADIAVIDSKSKVLLNNTQIASLAGQLVDYSANMVPGQLRTNWQNTLNTIYDLAATGAFRHSAVRTFFLPLTTYFMIRSL